MTRTYWQNLAEERLLDAQALIAAGRWSMAYYTVGYVVECGLKACILVRLANAPEVIFEEKRSSEKCWSHKFAELIDQAGLGLQLQTERTTNTSFDTNWETASEWSEASRYDPNSQADAEQLVDAVTDPANGVLQWIKSRW